MQLCQKTILVGAYTAVFYTCRVPITHWNQRKTKSAQSLYLLQLKTQAVCLLSFDRWHQQQMFFSSLFGPVLSLQTLEKVVLEKSLSIAPAILRPDINHATLKLTPLPFLPLSDAQLTLVIFATSARRSALTCCHVIG